MCDTDCHEGNWGVPITRLEGEFKSCIGGATTWLAVGSTISTLQVVERKCGTMKESMWELCDKGVAPRTSTSQGSCSHRGGCIVTWVGWEVTVGVTIHNEMSNLRQKGAGSRQLRHEVRAIFVTIYRQECINDSEVWGTVEFKFKWHYKNPRDSHETMLLHLIFKLLRRAQSV